MNFYIVVEGKRTEQKVFASWIPILNGSLVQVDLPGQLSNNNFVIVSGFGFPNYLKIITNAAIDITRNPHYGQLVISVDAEDTDPDVIRDKIVEVVEAVSNAIVPEIVVQNACIESWFLGNRRSIRRFPHTIEALDWQRFYDVWVNCPELMPARTESELNRAQTAHRYLVHSLRDRGSHLRYSKKCPNIVCHASYLSQLQQRVDDTGHLDSFGDFVRIF